MLSDKLWKIIADLSEEERVELFKALELNLIKK